MIYSNYIEGLMQFYAEGDFVGEATQAKSEFYELAGIFDEQSSQFDQRMAQFTDWYLFSRELSNVHVTPIKHYVNERPVKIPEQDEMYFDNLSKNRHSLFEFIKIKGPDLHVKDLFSGYKHVIKNSEVTLGFTKDELFQARLVPHEDTFVFSGSFCFHPPAATKFILSEVKKLKKIPEADLPRARELLLLRFFRMRNKFDQYQHVGINEIYSNDSRLRI